MWSGDLGNCDIVHMFSARGGALDFHKQVRACGIPQVLSPIIWLEKGAAAYPVGEIQTLFHLCDRVLPNSHAEKTLFESFFNLPADRYDVVHNGIDPTFATGPGPELFHDQFGIEPFVLCVANIESRKNQLRLIEACIQSGRNLVLIGSVRDHEYMAACKDQADPTVHFLDPIPHDSDMLKSAYQACSVHVLASHFETPGLSTLEAACLGAPVVATQVGCAQEYLNNFAKYVDPNATESIAKGIDDALSSPPQADACRRHLLEHFTWEQVARQLLSVYESVLQ